MAVNVPDSKNEKPGPKLAVVLETVLDAPPIPAYALADQQMVLE